MNQSFCHSLKNTCNYLFNKRFGHFSQYIGCKFRHLFTVFTNQPENRGSCRWNCDEINQLGHLWNNFKMIGRFCLKEIFNHNNTFSNNIFCKENGKIIIWCIFWYFIKSFINMKRKNCIKSNLRTVSIGQQMNQTAEASFRHFGDWRCTPANRLNGCSDEFLIIATDVRLKFSQNHGNRCSSR